MPQLSEGSEHSKFFDALEKYVVSVRIELAARWDAWDIDLANPEKYVVVGGLVARQVSLATQLAHAPRIWTPHVAPVILRTMVDTYITLAWILKEPVERSRQFILYGLGQDKLILEHHKARIAAAGEQLERYPEIRDMEDWINSQRFTFLTEVNVGSWSGIDTRTMAEEAGCLDIYRFAYTPFSAATHSTWSHIVRYNLKMCFNPLHRYHHVPTDLETPIDPDYLCRAAKHVQETFDLFDKSIGRSAGTSSAFAELLDVINSLYSHLGEDSPSA